MYVPSTPRGGRAATILLVVLIHLALGYAFLTLSGTGRDLAQQANLAVFDVIVPPPPPEQPPPPQVEQVKPKPKEDEGAASAPNIKSKATPVAAPKPRIALPVPAPMPVAEKPSTGNDATSGASDVVGPGTGAGGTGTGTGSGASGNGNGGGGEGSRPSVIQSTTLTSRDYPSGVRRSWPRGGRVYVAVRVQLDGRATDCKVNRSVGIPEIDQWTCRLVEQKVRFRPAVDGNGRPYVAWYGYVQYPVNF